MSFNKIKMKFLLLLAINFSAFAVEEYYPPAEQEYQPISAEQVFRKDNPYEKFTYSIKFDYLIEKDGDKLFCKNIKDNYKEISSVEIPKIENKVFFNATAITNRFISVTLSDKKRFFYTIPNFIPYDTNYINEKYSSNPEYFIWDLEFGDRPNLFKIDNPDFTGIKLHEVTQINNQDHILVHEIYKKTGDDNDLLDGKGLYRYRFYNLFERNFNNEILFSSYDYFTFYNQKNSENDITPKYAIKYNGKDFLIHKASKSDEGKFEIGEEIYQISQENIFDFSVKKESLLFYKQESEYYVPFLFDLNKREEICLLEEDERKDIKSDIYNAFITKTDDILIYFTHFDKSKAHTKIMSSFKNDEKAKKRKVFIDEVFKQEVFKQIGTLDLDSRLFQFFLENENNFQEKKEKLFNLFELNKDLFEIKNYQKISKQFQVSDYLYNNHKFQDLKGKIIPSKAAILKTADQKFDMPVYYTKHPKPNNWSIIEIHGGPHLRDFNEFNLEQQFWSSLGFSYVVTNIRGSNGFGEEYKKASDGKWYEVVDDIKQVIDWVKANGLGENIIVKGTSFGGYASAASFAKGYADNIIAINGLYDLEQNLSDVKAGKTKFSKDDLSVETLQSGNTEEIRKENSVNTHLKYNPNGNMLIIAGLNDDNCLPIQSQNLFKQMTDLSNKAELLTIEGEGHSILKQENKIMVLKLQEAFVAKITGLPYLDKTGYQLVNQTEGVEIKYAN